LYSICYVYEMVIEFKKGIRVEVEGRRSKVEGRR